MELTEVVKKEYIDEALNNTDDFKSLINENISCSLSSSFLIRKYLENIDKVKYTNKSIQVMKKLIEEVVTIEFTTSSYGNKLYIYNSLKKIKSSNNSFNLSNLMDRLRMKLNRKSLTNYEITNDIKQFDFYNLDYYDYLFNNELFKSSYKELSNEEKDKICNELFLKFNGRPYSEKQKLIKLIETKYQLGSNLYNSSEHNLKEYFLYSISSINEKYFLCDKKGELALEEVLNRRNMNAKSFRKSYNLTEYYYNNGLITDVEKNKIDSIFIKIVNSKYLQHIINGINMNSVATIKEVLDTKDTKDTYKSLFASDKLTLVVLICEKIKKIPEDDKKEILKNIASSTSLFSNIFKYSISNEIDTLIYNLNLVKGFVLDTKQLSNSEYKLIMRCFNKISENNIIDYDDKIEILNELETRIDKENINKDTNENDDMFNSLLLYIDSIDLQDYMVYSSIINNEEFKNKIDSLTSNQKLIVLSKFAKKIEGTDRKYKDNIINNLGKGKNTLKFLTYHYIHEPKDDRLVSGIDALSKYIYGNTFISKSTYSFVNYLLEYLLSERIISYADKEVLRKDFEAKVNNFKKTKGIDLFDIRDNVLSFKETCRVFKDNHEYSPEIINKIKEPYNNRNNYTDIDAITIDRRGADLYDDAYSIKLRKNGTYDLYIFISDPTNFLKINPFMYKEILKREETIYLMMGRDRELFDLYPSEIALNNLSINPYNNTNTHCLHFNITKDGEILNYDIKDTVIKSRYDLTYNKANEILNTGSYDPILNNQINDLYLLSKNFNYKNTSSKGYADVISKYAIFANHFISQIFEEKGLPYISVYNKTDESDTFYSYDKKGHEYLGLDTYTQFTSPARRAADSYMHDLIRTFFVNKYLDDKTVYNYEEKVKKLIPELNKNKIEISYLNK